MCERDKRPMRRWGIPEQESQNSRKLVLHAAKFVKIPPVLEKFLHKLLGFPARYLISTNQLNYFGDFGFCMVSDGQEGSSHLLQCLASGCPAGLLPTSALHRGIPHPHRAISSLAHVTSSLASVLTLNICDHRKCPLPLLSSSKSPNPRVGENPRHIKQPF